jgi:multidrug efflux pump subunit AcrB
VIKFFLDRHLLVHVITIMVLGLGVIVLGGAQREGFPAVTINEVIVTAMLPGASPEDVAIKLARPLEEAIREVDGVDTYHSESNESVVRVVAEIYADFTPEQVLEVERDIQKAVDAITDFPADMESPPTLFRFNPAKMHVLEVALRGPMEARRAAAVLLEPGIGRLPGVSSVDKVGWGDPQIEVQVDPLRARAQNITLDEVIAALKRRNVSSTGGKLTAYPAQRQVVLSGRYSTVDDVAQTVLRFGSTATGAGPDGRMVGALGAAGGVLRVRDVARVVATYEDTGMRLHAEGEDSTHLAIRKRANSDILETVDGIREYVEQASLPEGVRYSFYNDQSKLTRNRLRIVIGNGLGGGVLVLLVLLAFLSRRVACWIAFGVPFALLGVMTSLPLLGITVNMVSLAGFVVVIGLVVDDAIIVAERIAFYMEQGVPAREAALRGTNEMAVPVIGASITTILAFSPLFLLGGIPGKFAWAIPTIVIITLAISLFECFCILPSHLVGRSEVRRAKPNWLLTLEAAYASALRRVLPRAGLVALMFVGGFFGTLLYARANLGLILFPQDDSDAFFIKIRLPEGASIEATEATVRALAQQLPVMIGDDFQGVTARIGHQREQDLSRNFGSADNEAVITVFLRERFTYNAPTWIGRVESRLVFEPGVGAVFSARRIGPPLGRPVTVHISTPDEDLRRVTSAQVMSWIRAQPEITGIEMDARAGLRQVDLDLDYERLALKKVSVETVGRTVKAAFFGVPVTEVTGPAGNVEVRVRLDPAARGDLEMLSVMPVRAEDGRAVQLRDVISPVEVDAVAGIFHRAGVRTTTITGSLVSGSGVTPTSMARRMEAELVPQFAGQASAQGDRFVYVGGEAKKSAETVGDMPKIIGFAFIGIILVVMLLTNSLLQAVFVVSAVPLGLIGVVWAFAAHGISISMFAFLGVTGLCGVVVNDSIVMVTSLNRVSAETTGLNDLYDEVVEGAKVRLRPVILTTLTTVAGVMPTAYGLGGRDAVLSPMSMALGWGLIFATVITLFLVPSLYVVRRRVELWRGR